MVNRLSRANAAKVNHCEVTPDPGPCKLSKQEGRPLYSPCKGVVPLTPNLHKIRSFLEPLWQRQQRSLFGVLCAHCWVM